MEGPGKGTHSWDKANDKYWDSVRSWSTVKKGLQLAIRAHNTYSSPILSFLSQLEPLPPHIVAGQSRITQRIAPGPYSWISLTDLYYAKDYGMNCELRSVEHTSWAAQIRVAFHDGSKFAARRNELAALLWDTDCGSRRANWKDWYKQCHYSVLFNTMAWASSRGINEHSLAATIEDMGWGKSDDPCILGTLHFKQFAQRAASYLIHRTMAPTHVYRIRHKLIRWQLPSVLGHASERVLTRLRSLSSIVAPRVIAATLRMIWNGWCTARRFQSQARCVFGCSASALDCVEQYPYCLQVRILADRKLRRQVFTLEQNLLAAPSMTEADIKCVVLLNYSIFTALIALDGKFRQRTDEEIQDILEHRLFECARGHPKTAKFLESIWAT